MALFTLRARIFFSYLYKRFVSVFNLFLFFVGFCVLLLSLFFYYCIALRFFRFRFRFFMDFLSVNFVKCCVAPYQYIRQLTLTPDS